MILSRGGRVVLASLVASACGAAGTDQPVAPLVATTSVWADVVSNVACGEPVAAIVPAGADPHGFEPSLRDRELLERAAVVVANGAGLEESLVDLLATVAADGVLVVELASHVDVIADDDQIDDEHAAGDDEHGHGVAADPHIWLDPTRVAGALDVIASAVTASGRDQAAIDRCADAYRAELVALDAEIAARTSALPPENRVLVTNHDSLAYFADRYDFEVLGTVIPSTSTIAETNPAALAELRDLIAVHDVPAIFTDRFESSADADALAERIGVAVVQLDMASLGDPPADTYVGMLGTNAGTIAEVLAP